ncbi:high affinity immunoglobulin gamma Fc receptor I-like isoform X4 [Motacilla alba alba]|uniref:high affinity immunoglobulin gamma Fc receptor I-like isoform X4 n=1 Tax=Motacilla alba alba TaxID=1094192 RepID=UPI0018D5A0D6|nr:high affinity immunoglobulin gamma Fc receptor I-like isoform X4 [Motacilla alba alba]
MHHSCWSSDKNIPDPTPLAFSSRCSFFPVRTRSSLLLCFHQAAHSCSSWTFLHCFTGPWGCGCGAGGGDLCQHRVPMPEHGLAAVSLSSRPLCHTSALTETFWEQPPHPVSPSCCPHGATPTEPCPFSLPAQTLGLAGAQTTQLLVEPPWRPAVLWDRVTLTCQGSGAADATTWYKDGQHWWQKGPYRFTVTESGTYKCDRPGTGISPPMSILNERLVLQLEARVLMEGDMVTLRCRGWQDGTVTGVRFYHKEKDLGGPLNGTELSLSPLQLHHSGCYRCGGWVKSGPSPWWEKSAAVTVTVTVHVPVANATLTPSPPAHQVRAGDNVTLHCSVQVGSAPVTFTWLHNGQEVAQGPLLELRDIDVGHLGTYQCVATNQLGQDGHRMFRALSPELVLLETPDSHWVTVAVNVGRTLLFLLLLLAVIGGCHWWHHRASRKPQDRVSLRHIRPGDQHGAARTPRVTAGPQ